MSRYCTACWHRTWAREFMVRCQLTEDLMEYRDTCPSWVADGDEAMRLKRTRDSRVTETGSSNHGAARPQDDRGGKQ